MDEYGGDEVAVPGGDPRPYVAAGDLLGGLVADVVLGKGVQAAPGVVVDLVPAFVVNPGDPDDLHAQFRVIAVMGGCRIAQTPRDVVVELGGVGLDNKQTPGR
ncbi:hypothetical protein K4749_22735 [Streptomyces sp. TRM72054]|uniref:hypothetical protein n=1 Tax=Streptomyces sp. TRM72054 TaxID=2870562 RepID=UPI001C8C8032|nr:hypothetical protein [Streptomyces sp. TRM72054]MBX9396333.1 hypothetical protein [Streptomyces sp. TRM72054]